MFNSTEYKLASAVSHADKWMAATKHSSAFKGELSAGDSSGTLVPKKGGILTSTFTGIFEETNPGRIIHLDGRPVKNGHGTEATAKQWVLYHLREKRFNAMALTKAVLACAKQGDHGIMLVDKDNCTVYIYTGGVPAPLKACAVEIVKTLGALGTLVGEKGDGQVQCTGEQTSGSGVHSKTTKLGVGCTDVVSYICKAVKEAVKGNQPLADGIRPLAEHFPSLLTAIEQSGPSHPEVLSFVRGLLSDGNDIESSDIMRLIALKGALKKEFPPHGLQRKMKLFNTVVRIMPAEDTCSATFARGYAISLYALLRHTQQKRHAGLSQTWMTAFDAKLSELGGGCSCRASQWQHLEMLLQMRLPLAVRAN